MLLVQTDLVLVIDGDLLSHYSARAKFVAHGARVMSVVLHVVLAGSTEHLRITDVVLCSEWRSCLKTVAKSFKRRILLTRSSNMPSCATSCISSAG